MIDYYVPLPYVLDPKAESDGRILPKKALCDKCGAAHYIFLLFNGWCIDCRDRAIDELLAELEKLA